MDMSLVLRKMVRMVLSHKLQVPAGLSLRQLTVVLVVLALLPPPPVQAYSVCRNTFRCLNGGEEKYGQSIFGPCRCLCPHGYTGPRCQYRELTRKRSFNMLADFLRAQQQQQQQQEEQLAPDYAYSIELQQLQPQPEEQQPMQRQRRRVRLHPRFFFRR